MFELSEYERATDSGGSVSFATALAGAARVRAANRTEDSLFHRPSLLRFVRVVVGNTLLSALFGAPMVVSAANIKIDGSSTVYPVVEAFAEEFQIQFRGIHRITVGISGTGGGMKKFCRGETDVSNASRAIKPSEIASCAKAGIDFIEIPIALDAIAVVVHQDNDWLEATNVETLRTIFRQSPPIKAWPDLNSDFPNGNISIFAPGTDSGTFDYFKEVVLGNEPIRKDFTASEDDNLLVQGVSGDRYAIGFFGLAYLVENRDILKAVSIVPPDGGRAISPSLETARNGSYLPFSRPLFLYINAAHLGENEGLASFLEFVLTSDETTNWIEEVGYAPLDPASLEAVRDRIERRITGSTFSGLDAGDYPEWVKPD